MKTFEVRKDDRDYKRNDILLLKEHDGSNYTGNELEVFVSHIMRGENCKDGYCIMSVIPMLSSPSPIVNRIQRKLHIRIFLRREVREIVAIDVKEIMNERFLFRVIDKRNDSIIDTYILNFAYNCDEKYSSYIMEKEFELFYDVARIKMYRIIDQYIDNDKH